MKRLFQSMVGFIGIGLVLYALVYAAAEWQLYRTGHSNPMYKIATAEHVSHDWLILGASHAMPLDFGDFQSRMESVTGQSIVNLAAPGAGPLYNRFVLEQFLRQHRARKLLYVADSFAFYSHEWNEDRFGDAKLLARTPWNARVARSLVDYVRRDGVSPRAALDYMIGFSKINNRDRFRRDAWEGEAQFERVYMPSTSASVKRIAYLYPDGTPPAALQRYVGELAKLIDVARSAEMEVVIVKMPVPSPIRSRLPDEAAFDATIARLATTRGLRLHDFSTALDEPRFYFDSDHLNRNGVTELLQRSLRTILAAPEPG